MKIRKRCFEKRISIYITITSALCRVLIVTTFLIIGIKKPQSCVSTFCLINYVNKAIRGLYCVKTRKFDKKSKSIIEKEYLNVNICMNYI